MADGHDSGRGDGRPAEPDPLERYFRPRPGGGRMAGDGGEDGIEGVTIDGRYAAPRVAVDGPRGPRRPGCSSARARR